MTGKTLSNRVKKQKASRAAFEKLQKAVTAYQDSIAAGKKEALRSVATRMGVDHTTLSRHVNGQSQPIQQFNATKQNLTPREETVLVNLLLESSDRGFPLRHREVEGYANFLRQARLGVDCERPLDTQRARSLNPEAVKSWFEVVKKFIVDGGVDPKNIYGMDESGFPLAYPGKERVIGARGTKTQHKQGGADRENVTAVVTICADGTSIRPLLIFKGKNVQETWVHGNTVNAKVTCSHRGWTDGDIGVRWLEDVFEKETSAKANGRARVLLLDGHSSHYTVEFIEFAMAQNIILLGYPAHCTHALQGLDVVCFARMKENWKAVITKFEDQNRRPADKRVFTQLFSQAYQASFTPETVQAAFEHTGIHPFDPSVISEAQLKPSLTTSVKGSFPLPQPSPVRAVMAAMVKQPPNTRTPTSTPPSTMPCTPSLRRRRSSLEPDPDLYTPSKRMRALYTSIASTSSGSFLVSTDKLTSATPIIAPVLEATPSLAQPDWSMADRPTTASTLRELQRENEMLKAQLRQAQVVDRAKDGIIEGRHATMVIQNFHLIKQNGALHGKELQKTSNRTSTLDTSRGQCYSTEEVLADLRAKRARKEAEEARKKAGRDVRAARKEAKAQIEAEWVRIKSQHAENCEAWKKACDQLKSEGVPKKEWPKAPTRPRKPTIPVHFGAVEEVEDDDDEEEEEETID